ncbi:hypothetical protein DSO57_1013298 [Entomophthora muscae]|uniref:Uncharacterized protein n=1 Tax=Entomophthora muscae TaxID=34485 RepID=A0ACC2SUX9_9FUNG|nr:hypothetical protein DSO57_1013298 [Entomophthora muscae]
MTASCRNYKQFVAFQQWAHDLLLFLLANQYGFLLVQQHLQSTEDVFSYKVGQAAWQESIKISHTSQGAGLDNLIQKLNQLRGHLNNKMVLLETYAISSSSVEKEAA